VVEEATVEEVEELAEQPEAVVEEPPTEEPLAEQVDDRVDTVEAEEAQPAESKEEAEEEAPIEQEEVEDGAEDQEDKK